ncbi:response regulator transcription factor [Streptomyces sp. MI02-7b]|uniref:response regulator transcription factor n=1 Tax=Streptomyces sp. MI02-7b TaxID=462941 RepID=UPI0029AE2C16|nr:response regulator transcription factor [Streptomyces sp. MI02-7b]MDX3078387.1 response regulator transcription factor [Streptomyces sp. MI02-7b]
MITRLRIVVADDHTLFRDGVRELLSIETQFEVVGEAAGGVEAIAVVERTRPDIVLLDVQMPGPPARDVLDQLRVVSESTRVIILSMHDEVDTVNELVANGAAAYLVKSIPRDELVAAIRSTANSPATVRLTVSRQTMSRLSSAPDRADQVCLTMRELTAIRFVSAGLTNMQIGTQMRITEATVKRHLTSAYAKLGAVSRVDAIRKAEAASLLPPPAARVG